MFSRKNVDAVMNKIRKDVGYFASEAHLQMSFISAAEQLYQKQFVFLPEYPVQGKDKRYELDLLIVDKISKERTIIEFKYKTKAVGNVTAYNDFDYRVNFDIHNNNSHNLDCFDCWSDIARIEELRLNKNTFSVNNGFFIFVTNDQNYKNGLKQNSKGIDFSMKAGPHDGQKTMKWKKPINVASIAEHRNRDITISEQYDFAYNQFNNEFDSLIVEI